MKFGLTHGNIGRTADPTEARALAVAAEEAGFESLWTVDHAVVPTYYERVYPETASGEFPFPVDHPLADPLPWLTWVGAATTRIRLGTAILVLPQRNVLITAKEAATVDRLTGGRLILGVGVGWCREEFEVLGADFDTRGRRLREAIPALRALWTGEPAGYASESVTFDGVVCQPRPANKTVPIHIGGFSMTAAARAGRIADGFFPAGYGDLDRLAALIARTREAAVEAGRDPADIEITTRWTRDPSDIDPGLVDRLAELGVSRVTVPAMLFDAEDLPGSIRRFGDTYLAAHR